MRLGGSFHPETMPAVLKRKSRDEFMQKNERDLAQMHELELFERFTYFNRIYCWVKMFREGKKQAH